MFAQLTHTNERQDLQIQHTCGDCGLRTENFFCQLPAAELARFEALKVTKAYPKGTLLFIEGQRPAGIYMLCQGQVKLSTCSSDGKIIILGIAGPGDVLGLSAVIADVECEVTAEVLEICQVNFVPKDAFLNLIKEDPAVCLSAVRQLGSSYQTAHKMICSLGLSESVFVKLGKLLLSWGPPSGNGNGHASDEFPILTDTRSRSRDLRFGAEGKLFGFDWGLSQGFRTFKDRSTGFLDAVNQGNNPTNQSRLDTYFRSSPINGDVYFTQFHAHRTFAEKFDFTARMIYSSASSHSSRVQTMTGRDNTNPTGILVTSDSINVMANAKRPQTRGDLGITYAATDKFRISNTVSFDQFSVNGDEMFQEIWTKASGSTLRSTTQSSAYRVNSYRRFVNTIEADYQFSNAVALHVGYRYTKRDINNNGFDKSCTFTTGLCTPTTTPFVESETNSTNALIAGMKIRPVKNWTIYWDVEHGLADNVFTRLENYKYTNFRVRSRVTLNKVSFNFSASSKDNENASLPKATITLPSTVNYITNTQNRYFSGTVDWDPMDNLSFSTGYNYRHLTSYTPVAVPISGAPGGYAFGFSQFFMRDHYFYFDVTARPTNRVSLYASYRINRDKGQGDLVSSPITIAAANFITSYPMQFASPEGRVVFRISRNVDWNVGYQYYDYKDAQTPFMNYRAHLPYTSLRIYFGGRAADR